MEKQNILGRLFKPTETSATESKAEPTITEPIEPTEPTENNQEENQEGKDEGEQKSSFTVEDWEQFIQSPEGMKLLQPKLDRYFTKGLETWKQNNLEKIVNQEIQKRNPTDPKEREIQQLKKDFENMQKVNQAMKFCEEFRLPVEMSEFLVKDTPEATKKAVQSVRNYLNKSIDLLVRLEVDNRFKQTGKIVSSGEKLTLTKEDLAKMDYAERAELYTRNPDLFHRLNR